jgi:hypothetical protein
MNDIRREYLERTYRPDLFENCQACGETEVRIGKHTCDPVRRMTYQASLEPPPYQPNPEWVAKIGETLLSVLMKHRIVITSDQLKELAEVVEPMTHGPSAL